MKLYLNVMTALMLTLIPFTWTSKMNLNSSAARLMIMTVHHRKKRTGSQRIRWEQNSGGTNFLNVVTPSLALNRGNICLKRTPN